MEKVTDIVDQFEYKGKNITVYRDVSGETYFKYTEEEKEIRLSIKEIKSFIESSFSHTTINNNVVDIIERSVKINSFLFNIKDLKNKIKRYN